MESHTTRAQRALRLKTKADFCLCRAGNGGVLTWFVSGQTGADRAALDWALAHGIECGGWCSKGWKAEDEPIDAKYPLKETPSVAYIQRTEWDVRDSDATVLFSIEPTLTGGSLRTMEFARKHGKPHLHLCAGNDKSADNLRAFFEGHDVKVLNVAGPRMSNEPGVGEFVISTLQVSLARLVRWIKTAREIRPPPQTPRLEHWE